ncbi:putative vegetative incompatibility HET containing-domain protein [Cercophora samala]|uniref:Vegetative incompatibility HET containing-domain protein n=1 Tax=Cercophora samala TaxID=330535 RepID=A0AA39ZCM8_9PEZI|nr:putative vegetative incompatibility HET containing-domain protein [Cercophora samala]
MWLIDCNTYQLRQHDINGPSPTPYLILSHTWRDDEVTHAEMKNSLDVAKQKKGFAKIKGISDVAVKQGYTHVWVDTCCIDKTSSAELTESINSMFHWYSNADKCIVYLDDLTLTTGLPSEDQLRPCRWFTRSWTLQELVAPEKVDFYDSLWQFSGTKDQLRDKLHKITRVDLDVLGNPEKLTEIPVGKRMSWAANRKSTRIEDRAYSLLGIFQIHMPLIYGEGHQAFHRLQECIAQKTNDMSLFAWKKPLADASQTQYSGLFAKHPLWFNEAASITNIIDPVIPSPSWIITNTGLEMYTSLEWSQQKTGYRLHLHCTYQHLIADDSLNEGTGDPSVLTIWLRKTRSGFIRYRPFELPLTRQSTMTFGNPAVIRISYSISTADLTETTSFYHPQAHLLTSSINFKWDNVRAPQLGFKFTTKYYPEHLWDSQRLCFLTSKRYGFIGLVEITISAPTGVSAWEGTCFVLCGLMLVDGSPHSWILPLVQNDDGSIDGLGYKRCDLINPYMLSTIGVQLRTKFRNEEVLPPSSGEIILRYGKDGFLQLSASVLSRHDQLEMGSTNIITIHHVWTPQPSG